jgi:hypothetical protein
LVLHTFGKCDAARKEEKKERKGRCHIVREGTKQYININEYQSQIKEKKKIEMKFCSSFNFFDNGCEEEEKTGS